MFDDLVSKDCSRLRSVDIAPALGVDFVLTCRLEASDKSRQSHGWRYDAKKDGDVRQ